MQIPAELIRRILSHAVDTYPAECCGLLVGRGEQVHAVEPVRNLHAHDRQDRFEIDPVDHVRVFEAARAVGDRIIGCYHSHPNGLAQPSSLDRRLARRFGGPFGYLVVALGSDVPCEMYAGQITPEGDIIRTRLEVMEKSPDRVGPPQ